MVELAPASTFPNAPAKSAEGPLQVRRVGDLEALASLRPAWEGLLAKIPTASIFSAWEWLAPWWRAYGSDRELIALAFHNPEGDLVGLAPLARTERRMAMGLRLRVLEFMGDGSEDSDNLDILALPGWEPAVARRLLRYLTEEERGWDAVMLNLAPSYSPVATQMRQQLRSLRWTSFESTHPWCVLHLPETWEAYLSQVSAKERDNIRYYERRLLRRCAVRFYKCASQTELPVCLQALFDLHQMRWTQRGEPGSFAWDARCRFYHDMGRELLERKQLEFWLMDINGQPAAAQFGFRFRDTVYALQQGFDLQYASLCVQDVLRAYVLRQIMTEGVRHYDFLGGTNLRKERWRPEVGHYIHLHFARPFTRGSLYLQAMHRKHDGKQWLRRTLPPAAWAALRKANQWVGRGKSGAQGVSTPGQGPSANDSSQQDSN